MKEKLSVKQMKFFKQGENVMNPENTISGDDVHYCSEEDRKMAGMREKRVKLFMQMELDKCRIGLGWLIRCQLLSRQLPRGGLPTKAPTFSSWLYRKFGEEIEKGNEGHITTYIKEDSQDVQSTTSTSSAHSSTAAENSIMLAITNAVH